MTRDTVLVIAHNIITHIVRTVVPHNLHLHTARVHVVLVENPLHVVHHLLVIALTATDDVHRSHGDILVQLPDVESVHESHAVRLQNGLAQLLYVQSLGR